MAVWKELKNRIPDNRKAQLKALLGRPTTRLHPQWRVLSSVGPVVEEHTIVDVGAHHGWFFHCWLDWCPKARVHAFEPTKQSFERMDALYGDDPRVCLNQVGVGSTNGEMTLNCVTEAQICNSFLLPDQKRWDMIEYDSGDLIQDTVIVTTLDDYCIRNEIGSIYLMKIDVQGFESEVLKGAGGILERTDYVFVESGIERLYRGAPSFAEIYLDLEKRGFHLMTMRAWHRGNQRLVETDMLFRRNDLTPGIDRETDRYYLHLK